MYKIETTYITKRRIAIVKAKKISHTIATVAALCFLSVVILKVPYLKYQPPHILLLLPIIAFGVWAAAFWISYPVLKYLFREELS